MFRYHFFSFDTGWSRREKGVCPSVCPTNAWIVTKRKRNLSRFLYYTKDHLALSFQTVGMLQSATLLLNDTTLHEHQYRMGLADSKSCEADDGIEDAYHFFFECVRYSDNRDKLKQDIQRTWTDSGRSGSPSWSVALLLAP